jgi:DNA-binding response OmpR family regulator
VSDPTERDDTDVAASLATIFVVEDDADLGFTLLRFLEEEVPCRIVLSPDGFEALKLVRSLTPQLFLLDYHLPSMNGLELVDQLRATPSLQDVPIILMSARMPREGVNERHLHAIHKPFDFNDLLCLVRELLPPIE